MSTVSDKESLWDRDGKVDPEFPLFSRVDPQSLRPKVRTETGSVGRIRDCKFYKNGSWSRFLCYRFLSFLWSKWTECPTTLSRLMYNKGFRKIFGISRPTTVQSKRMVSHPSG